MAAAAAGRVRPGSGVVAARRRRGERAIEFQRARLLAAAVDAVDERGFEGVTVGHITARARVSRKTFYELFANRDECLLAMFDGAIERVRDVLADRGLVGLSWRERVRGGLWAVLVWFDLDPVLARCVVVRSAHGGGLVLARRLEVLRELALVVDQGREESAAGGGDVSPMVAEGVVGGVVSILYARLLNDDEAQDSPSGSLTGLLGELMGVVVLPYLGAGVARRERSRPAPAVPVFDGDLAGRDRRSRPGRPSGEAAGRANRSVRSSLSSFSGLPVMRLTYRTVRVLEGVAEEPGASNRRLADLAGVHDQGQISKLLSRLERLGLVCNEGQGGHAKGEPNSWSLTDTGERVFRDVHPTTTAAVGGGRHS